MTASSKLGKVLSVFSQLYGEYFLLSYKHCINLLKKRNAGYKVCILYRWQQQLTATRQKYERVKRLRPFWSHQVVTTEGKEYAYRSFRST
jgi:hypothetical protein